MEMRCLSNVGHLRLCGKNIMVDVLLLGVSVLLHHVAALEEPIVSLWPKGSEIYLRESVLLLCRVKSNSTFGWTYQWYRNKPHTALTPNPRHIVSGDSYSISAVTMEDEGIYWCKAEQRGNNTTIEGWVTLNVSELTPPSLTLTPSSRQVFSGERFTVQCPASQNNSTGWKLRHFFPGKSDRTKFHQRQKCLPPGGAVGANESGKCVLIADQENNGLYWCEGGGGRSSSVNITVSDGEIILKTPAFPVSEGDKVVLNCQHRTGNLHKATLFKDGTPVNPSMSSWTIAAVATKDEGFYKCVSQDRKIESPEGWLSVTQREGNFTSKDGTASSTNDAWKWIVTSCCVVLLFLIPLIWLIQRNRYRMFCTRSCWPLSKENIPAVPPPATKQDVTEVQWDLSWMEMSNLLDKQLYPGK
ncbi:hypothetical protein ATANTOWER_012518 [Ataeniobius toweri]|uniref:Ig-like domain-containing protein n=1 Tax=Ataeniobius toweri TaxID=208326 RepID=A0ABU7A6B8_9TELE|nr:hypothetical protein [Ataeniobius toweri]